MHHGHELSAEVTCRSCGEPVRRAEVTRQQLAPGWDVTGPISA